MMLITKEEFLSAVNSMMSLALLNEIVPLLENKPAVEYLLRCGMHIAGLLSMPDKDNDGMLYRETGYTSFAESFDDVDNDPIVLQMRQAEQFKIVTGTYQCLACGEYHRARYSVYRG